MVNYLKLFSAVSFALSCIILNPGRAVAGTLWNGTFENNSIAPWTIFQGQVAVGSTAHSGSYGLTMGPGTAQTVVSQWVVGLIPGQTYNVSAWVMASSASGASVELAVAGPNGLAGTPVTPTATWQQISQPVTVGANGYITIYLGQLRSSSATTVYWDDVSILAVPPANAGFESGLLSPWTISEGSAAVGPVGHSGSYGLTLGPGTAQAIVCQTLSGLVPGQVYTVSGWVKGSATLSAGAELAVGGVNGIAGSPANLTANWQQVSQAYTVGADGVIIIYVGQLASFTAQTVYWDDITVASSNGTLVSGPNVLTYHNDQARTGQNTGESLLTPSNVASSTFGKLFTRPVDGYVLAQPLYVNGQFVSGSGFHNVVVAATEEDSVYLFDGDSNQGANANALWHIKLIDAAHGGQTGETSAPSGPCNFGPPNEGVTSTPVIDANSGVLYVESKSSAGGNVLHKLHAIDMPTGAEEPGWPIIIGGSVTGNGDGSVNGQLTFNPNIELNRPGLLLSGGGVYVTFASNGCDSDFGDVYHGWIFRYDAATGVRSLISITPNGHADTNGAPVAGGIWMSGAAPAADASANVFLATSNGAFDTTLNASGMPSMSDFSDSILKIAPGAQLTISDYFTPTDQSTLNDKDFDLGAGGVLLLPDQTGPFPHLLVEAGKEGTIRLVNRDSLMHYCGTCASDPVVQELIDALPNAELGMPAYWNGFVYFGALQDILRGYSVNNGLLSTSPAVTSSDRAPVAYGTTPSVSSAGTSNGVIWGIQDWAGPPSVNGVLKAWNATTLTNLYSSNDDYSSDNPGSYAEFTVPTVAHGKVYVGTASNITVYGLLSGARSALVTNGTFESGYLSSPWNAYIPSGGFGTVTISSTAALGGNYGLMQGPSSAGEAAYQTIQGLTQGQTYLVSAWVKLASGVAGTVSLSAEDTTGSNICTSPQLTAPVFWAQIGCVYTANGTQAIRIHLAEQAGSFSTYWDNVTVSPVPPVNPGFETATLTPAWNSFIPVGATGGFAISPAAAHSGNSGLIAGSNSNGESVYQTIQGLTPGQSYVASSWLKLGSGNAGTAYLTADDTTGANACATLPATPGSRWQQIGCVYTATTNQSMNLHLVESLGSFSTYWDDVALTPIPPADGGFESGSFSQSWLPYVSQGAVGDVNLSALAAHSGNYGLVQGPTSGEQAVYQTVYGLTPGQSYVISAWVKLGSGTAGSIFIYANDTVYANACNTPLTTPTQVWQQISCTYTATNSQAVLLELVQASGLFTTYWDDVTLTPVPPVNGGFESGTFGQPWNASVPAGATVSPSAAHTGSYGLLQNPSSAGETVFQSVYGLTPGQAYQVSTWIRLASGTTGTAYLSVDDTTGANACQTAVVTATSAWQQIGCIYTATTNQAMKINLVQNAGSFSTDWDDVQVTGTLSTNLWQNFAPSGAWINFASSGN